MISSSQTVEAIPALRKENRQRRAESAACPRLADDLAFQQASVLKQLIDHGANLELKNKEGHTPLDVAKFLKHTTAIKLLQNAKILSAPKSRVVTLKEIPEGMVRIPPGRFVMGTPAKEVHRPGHETPLTEVTITQEFFMGAHEVTQSQFKQVINKTPSRFSGDMNVRWKRSRGTKQLNTASNSLANID